MNIINERIALLRAAMKKHNMDMYFVPTSDNHDSEYVNSYFQARAWLSGFTGSAGLLVVTQDKAVVWSDGRYFIQAEKQLKDTCIDFYRMGEPGVPSTYEFIRDESKEGSTLGFDGKVVSTIFGENLERALSKKDVKIVYDQDLVSEIWKDRPALPKDEIFELDVKYAGKSLQEKVSDVRNVMQHNQATKLVISSLDDIAWLLNVRGNDIECTPVVLSYLMLSANELSFYVDESKVNTTLKAYFENNGVTLKPYNQLYEDVKNFTKDDVVMIDKERANYSITKSINAEAKVISRTNPTTIMKAIKNPVELENLRKAHIKDGVAVTKFMYWLKNNVGKIAMDEVSVANYLHDCRASQEHFLDESFTTIAAYNANAAMMHYSAKEDDKAIIEASGMLLVDSGGQYLEGTTDITRTFGLGEVEDVKKRDFTLTLKGMIQLSKARFLEGCTGINLDILARQPLWDIHIDYKCGTGHGVGFVLGVHEGPHGIRWRQALNRKEDTPLQEGMVVTNEPGVYIEGSHGIRCENEMIVNKDIANEYGQFLDFETITFAPFDLDLIDKKYLDEATTTWLNAYHKEVYNKISPFLTCEEQEWLATYTREI